LQDIYRALGHQGVWHFPVINNGVCCGVVNRSRLLDALQARILGGAQENSAECSQSGQPAHFMERALHIHRIIGMGDLDMATPLPVWQLMDPAPYMLLGQMTAARFYPLYTKMGINAACIVNKDGEFCGILSRRDLIMATRHDHGEHVQKHGLDGGSNDGGGELQRRPSRHLSHGSHALTPGDVRIDLEAPSGGNISNEDGSRIGRPGSQQQPSIRRPSSGAQARGLLNRCMLRIFHV
jgi:hypothetical protein